MAALRTEDLPKEMQDKPRIHRNIIYICMSPISESNSSLIKKRREIFKPGTQYLLAGVHRPWDLDHLTKNPFLVYTIPEMPLPTLDEQGKKFAGFLIEFEEKDEDQDFEDWKLKYCSDSESLPALECKTNTTKPQRKNHCILF